MPYCSTKYYREIKKKACRDIQLVQGDLELLERWRNRYMHTVEQGSSPHPSETQSAKALG